MVARWLDQNIEIFVAIGIMLSFCAILWFFTENDEDIQIKQMKNKKQLIQEKADIMHVEFMYACGKIENKTFAECDKLYKSK